MYAYQAQDPGWCGDPRRGASHGRASDLPLYTMAALRVRRVPLEDGYDPGGAYWGTPEDLFCVWDADSRVRYLRAGSIDEVRDSFPRATWLPEEGPSDADIDDMLAAYIRCALWSSNDESDDKGGEPLDANYSESDVAPEARQTMRAVVEKFARDNAELLVPCIGKRVHAGERHECNWSQAGHDLWLSQSETGAGFGDGDWPRRQDTRLYEAAVQVERLYLCVGDDKKIHC